MTTSQPPLAQAELIQSQPELVTPEAQAARDAYRERLRQALRDPALRAIEGCPIGDDDAIAQLSDPPYYTACPNPFLAEILEKWQADRAELRQRLELPDDTRAKANGHNGLYHREPFAADVSEGKNDPIYSAHSYHTKVPHKAIMRYILHYTDPGDVVLDGFCGTGMTGVAAQLCGNKKSVEELGYRVDKAGVIYDGDKPISRLGARKAVLVDLSPAATFIAYNYNTPIEVRTFEREAQRILQEVEAECGWMYETLHTDGKTKGRISYTVWSEMFVCPQCGGEITFLDEAFDAKSKHVKEEFPCPHCGAALDKRSLDRNYITAYDRITGQSIKTLKRRPVLIEYTVGPKKFTKPVDEFDLKLLKRIEELDTPEAIPTVELPIAQMYHGSRLAPKGVTRIHHLFLPRARQALSALWMKAHAVSDLRLRAFLIFTVEQTIWGMSLLNRYGPTHFSQVNRHLAGVYYISSLISEVSPWYILTGKVKRLTAAFGQMHYQPGATAIATQSASVAPPLENCADYIFTDPPFGENIYYADLNYLVESWHNVRTNSAPEAIIDQAKHKDLYDYQALMWQAFSSYYRWLKPGHWLTVEFHNSHNAVWNAIQEALSSAGFVVADVRTLDKQQSSYRQVTADSAAKQDLVISAYKPLAAFEQRFIAEGGSLNGAWDFIQQHLEQLPAPTMRDGIIEKQDERQAYLLYDRMVAFHIRHSLAVPLSAPEFYQGLRQRCSEVDGMYFTPAQAGDYHKRRQQAQRVEQLALFVTDEKSTLQWLHRELDAETGHGPQTYQDIQPRFLRELHQTKYEKLPELLELLDQNFLKDDADRWYVPDPERQADLDALRQKSLLHEFNAYLRSKGRLKVFRSEAIRAGFSCAWRERDYETIVKVAERLPDSLLQEDQQLLMYYHNATLRFSDQPKQLPLV